MSNVDAMRALGRDIIASYDVRVSAIAELAKETADTLSNFAAEKQKMADALRASLAQGEADRKDTFDALLADIRAKQKERNELVENMLDSYKTEREEMAREWQELVATMQSRRSGATA